LTPFYWLVDVTGRRYDPPTAYPRVFYGFFAVPLLGLLFILAFEKARALPGSR
jgi:hypothetical protein